MELIRTYVGGVKPQWEEIRETLTDEEFECWKYLKEEDMLRWPEMSQEEKNQTIEIINGIKDCGAYISKEDELEWPNLSYEEKIKILEEAKKWKEEIELKESAPYRFKNYIFEFLRDFTSEDWLTEDSSMDFKTKLELVKIYSLLDISEKLETIDNAIINKDFYS